MQRTKAIKYSNIIVNEKNRKKENPDTRLKLI